MGQDFTYCDICGKRLTGEDFASGDGLRKGDRVFCRDCISYAAAETNVMPAAKQDVKKTPSSRVLPRRRSSRRKAGRRRPSTRKVGAYVKGSSSATMPAAGPPAARIQKVAASVVCPHCGEKLVVTVRTLPTDHVCELCGKRMRIAAPRG